MSPNATLGDALTNDNQRSGRQQCPQHIYQTVTAILMEETDAPVSLRKIDHMKEGHICILINPLLQTNCLRIVATGRTPAEVAAEISRVSGVPGQFLVAYQATVSDLAMAHTILQTKFSPYRLDGEGSYFTMPLEQAIKTMDAICNEVRTEVGLVLRSEADELFSPIASRKITPSKREMAELVQLYLSIREYLPDDGGLVFRIALASLYWALIPGQDDGEAQKKMAQFAADQFDSVIGAAAGRIVVEGIGEMRYFLPYHAYINRIFALLSLQQIREAERLYSILELRLADKELDGKEAMKRILVRQVGSVQQAFNDHKEELCPP